MEAGRLDEAEAAYKAEVQRDATDPKYLQAVNHLASLHFNGGRYGKAAQLYRYSASVNPADAETHQNLGSALAQSGRLREAVKSFQQALELDPGLDMARDNLRLAIEKINAQSGAPAPPR